jgi:hypothetical protein
MRSRVIPSWLLASTLAAALAIPQPPRLGAEEPRAVRDPGAVAAALASADREQRQAAAEEAKELQHPDLLAALLKAAKDEYRSVREPVWKALATRQPAADKAKAARAVETRLRELDRKPDSPDELAVVIQALHDLAQPSSIAPLLEGVVPTTETPVALARFKAVGNIPSKEAIEALLGHAQRGRGGATHRAGALQGLAYATGMRLPNLDAWLRWWSDAKRTWDPEAAATARAGQQAKSAERDAQRDAARGARRKAKDEGKEPGPGAEPPGQPEEPAGS